ncbi:MAG: sigma 54-interacting transcriptional regulator [Planctomycetota bacterium]|nr:sigma 54-interacting transcriptional regulator [Planctomycetota bacterium]
MKYRLVLINGPTPGASVNLSQDGTPVTIGRDVSRDFPLDDHLASRLHARVWFDGQSWQIEDCGSHNGTTVNSQVISRSVLEAGDLIRIGDRLIIFLGEADKSDAWNLSPSVVAASTSVVRIPSPNKRAELLEELRADTSARPVRLLSVLYRLATTLYVQPDVEQLARLARETLCEAIDAEMVNLWLADVDGRLRRYGGDAPIATRDDDHLLASIAVENDEAMLMGLHESSDEREGNRDDADESRSAIAVPIPASQRPRGAFECFRSVTHGGFGRDDLEFAVAVAHQFGMALENLEHRMELEQANEQLRVRLAAQTRLQGSSPQMQGLLDQVARVAPTTSTVLILGESGTGKELVSRMIHELSPRSAGPFVTVNCAAFSESLLESELFGHEQGAFTGAQQRRLGQFERAHRGTIFLDEIGETSPACQAKLLRLLEGHPFERLGGGESIRVDVRIVAATHRELPELVKAGRFREDLYYRLRVIELRVPPLRERGEDVLQLAVHFLEQYRHETGRGPRRFSSQAAEAVTAHGWPGNVRELKNAVERAVVLGRGEEIVVEDLGLPRADDTAAVGESQLVSLEEAQQRYILNVLRCVDGNKTQACKILRIGRGTLYKKLDRP